MRGLHFRRLALRSRMGVFQAHNFDGGMARHVYSSVASAFLNLNHAGVTD
jgi:hypothetical protein